MKLTAIIILMACLHLSAKSLGQNQRISVDFRNSSIKDVFNEIEHVSDYTVFYRSEDLTDLKQVNESFSNKSVFEILDHVLNGTNLSYVLKNRVIVVLPKDHSEVLTQQAKDISGRVTDSSGVPLPGVTVVVKGTTIGTITDANGKYELAGVLSEGTLVFSFVGMKKSEVVVSGKSTVDAVLEDETIGIEEVVAIGYGTVKKRDLTGSVSSVDAGKFQEQAAYSVENALAGRIAGVKVTDGAQPGSGASIQIRGANSMLGGTEPLYVVDGIPVEPNQDAKGQSVGGSVETSINFIDPSSIESIEVLKDASATSIYGARGANGVVLITTKQGKSGRQKLTFKYSLNIAKVSKHRDILDGPGFANWLNLSTANLSYIKTSWWDYQQMLFDNGQISVIPDVSPWGTKNTTEAKAYKWQFDGVERPLPDSPDLNNTNWQDEIFQTAITHNYNLGYSGGSDRGTFSFGLNYLEQEGILMGSGYERINTNLNINQKITEKIKVNSIMNFTKGNANALMTNNGHSIMNLITKVTSFAPTNKPLGAGETFEDFDFNAPQYQDSPIDIATKLVDDKEQINMLGSFGIDYKILKNLTFNATGALTYNANNRDTYWPMSTQRGEASKGDATSSRNQFFKYLTQYQLSYNKQFNINHRVNAVLVHSYEKFQFREDFLSVKNFPTDVLSYKNLASGLDYAVPQNNFYDSYLKSYLGRVNYSLKDRYLLTLSFRADGSSRFAKNNKWGYFPSGALAYRMIEESFVKDLNVFSNLKLRLSYGKTGGQAISPYQSLATLVTKNYTFDSNIASGFIENNLENPNLKWENTNQYNAGIDFGFLNNRFNLTLDAYYKKTTDLLMQVENPPSSGFATKIDNVGAVENKGVEAELLATILNGRLKWNVSGNISFNKNKVLEMGRNGFQYSSFSISGFRPIIFKEGEVLGAFTGFEKVKIFETWEEVYTSAQPGASIGDMMFKDQNLDGLLNEDDIAIIGDPNPDALWGVTNEFRYKSFDLSILIDGQIGGDIYSIEDMNIESNFRHQNATNHAAVNSWVPAEGVPGSSWEMKDGTIFSTEGYDYGFGNSDPYNARPMFYVLSSERRRTSDEYVKDATFIKLRNISLGYNLGSRVIKSIGVKNLRIYASATNLLVITKYDGFDPEVTAFNNSPSRRGLDLGTYPASRTITFGINATF